METFAALAHGMAVAVQPMNLLYALIGVFLGTAVGVLPGIGPALTVALLLPVTYKLDPGGSLIMFAGIYYGGMYGGTVTSVLINVPGESSSVMTALDGHQLARQGRAGPAADDLDCRQHFARLGAQGHEMGRVIFRSGGRDGVKRVRSKVTHWVTLWIPAAGLEACIPAGENIRGMEPPWLARTPTSRCL